MVGSLLNSAVGLLSAVILIIANTNIDNAKQTNNNNNQQLIQVLLNNNDNNSNSDIIRWCTCGGTCFSASATTSSCWPRGLCRRSAIYLYLYLCLCLYLYYIIMLHYSNLMLYHIIGRLVLYYIIGRLRDRMAAGHPDHLAALPRGPRGHDVRAARGR